MELKVFTLLWTGLGKRSIKDCGIELLAMGGRWHVTNVVQQQIWLVSWNLIDSLLNYVSSFASHLTFYGFLTWWTHEINPKHLGNISSVIPRYQGSQKGLKLPVLLLLVLYWDFIGFWHQQQHLGEKCLNLNGVSNFKQWPEISYLWLKDTLAAFRATEKLLC